MLQPVPCGSSLSVQTDRMSVSGQEISFLEDSEFCEWFTSTLSVIKPKLRDANVSKIFWRAHVAISLFSQATVGRAAPVYVECGTHLGVISQMILRFQSAKRTSELKTYLFDTWNGIPESQIGTNEPLAAWHNQNNYCEDTYEFVEQIFASFPNVFLIRGIIPQTLSEFDDTQCELSMLHLDMNIVSPEKAALDFFWPRIAVGGVVLLDDYGFAKHTEQRNFYDSFFGDLGLIVCQLPTGQAFVLKNNDEN